MNRHKFESVRSVCSSEITSTMASVGPSFALTSGSQSSGSVFAGDRGDISCLLGGFCSDRLDTHARRRQTRVARKMRKCQETGGGERRRQQLLVEISGCTHQERC